MVTAELSEYRNLAIQNGVISEESSDDEENKESVTSSIKRDRDSNRITCTYRELARHQR